MRKAGAEGDRACLPKRSAMKPECRVVERWAHVERMDRRMAYDMLTLRWLLAGRIALMLGMAGVVVTGCAGQTGRHAPLVPPPTPVELGLAAQALEDSSIGPVFPPERLTEGVALLRRIHRQAPVAMRWHGSELIWHPSLVFQMVDSVFWRLFDSAAGQRAGSVNRWLEPPRTGWLVFDSVTAAMGGAVAIHIEGLPRRHGFLSVFYREPVNLPGVARAYAGLKPAVTISMVQGPIVTSHAVSDRLRIKTGDSLWTLHLPAGWGDCPDRPHQRTCEFRYRPATGWMEAVTDSESPH